MYRDLKIQSKANKGKAKYEVEDFCTQYGLPSILPKRKSKYRGKETSEHFHRKKTKAKYYRKQKYSKDDFYKKGKSKSTGKFIPKASGKCFNCGKKGHLRKKCKAKAKTLINTLISDQAGKDEIFKLLKLNHSDSETSSSKIRQIYQSSSESSRVSSNTSSSSNEAIACMDSCCRNKTINVLSKQEELLLDLIEQIKDPVTKAQKLTEFKRTLVKETSKPETKLQEPKVDLEQIYKRFTKSKKEVTVNDLQKEIKETKSEVRTLKQELTILRVDHNFLDQRLKNLENTSH
ncbi:uncharacterized protein LOC136062357 [Quercus suber]|uniref:uncharacterized protein LOC136062357 n=1 Tax=Quercus suber TaxID=58331 RepID=UPI0032DE47E4